MIRKWFSTKKAPAIFGRKAGPERIGTTMNNIKELNNGCKLNNLLKYHNLLSKARQVTDHEGLKFIETELKRAKEMFLFLESTSMFGEGWNE